MDERITEIRKHLKKKLNPMRYEHTLGVSYTCMALAMRYSANLDQAEMAGLLHDCASMVLPIQRSYLQSPAIRPENRRCPC